MQIKEIIKETDRAFLVIVEYENESFRFWVPKSYIRDYDVDDDFAMEKIESCQGSYQDPDTISDET